MATVRITSNLVADVANNLRASFNPRLEALRVQIQALSTDVIPLMENKYGQERFQLAQKLEAMDPYTPWGVEARRVRFRIPYTNHRGEQKIYILEKNLDSPRPFVPHKDEWVVSLDVPPGNPICAKAEALVPKYEQIMEERDNLVEELAFKVVQQCTTLRQVLKIWPSALDFMPAWAVERHHEKVARKRSKTPDIEIDNATHVALTKARMMKT